MAWLHTLRSVHQMVRLPVVPNKISHAEEASPFFMARAGERVFCLCVFLFCVLFECFCVYVMSVCCVLRFYVLYVCVCVLYPLHVLYVFFFLVEEGREGATASI